MVHSFLLLTFAPTKRNNNTYNWRQQQFGIKAMTTIYCITEWDSDMNLTRRELFMSISGVANWLIKQKPIGNQFNVTDIETAGDYDITAENLTNVLAAAEVNNRAAWFTIKQEFIILTFEKRFTLSTVNVND